MIKMGVLAGQLQDLHKSRHMECSDTIPVWTDGPSAKGNEHIKPGQLGLSETRWPGQGRFVSDSPTILYSGNEQYHIRGVGIIISRNASQVLVGWKPVSERIITARLHTKHAKVTIVQVHAPTEVADIEEKERFYNQL